MSLSNAQRSIDKIRNILRNLYVQARDVDKQTSDKASNSNYQHKLFDQTFFKTKSRKLLPYVTEVEKELQHAEQLIIKKQSYFLSYQLEKIENQCSAIITALNATDSLKVFDNYKKAHRNKHRFKQAFTKLVQPIQDVYAKLSETHEFERRLITMLHERESQLANAHGKNQEQLKSEVLTIHQRLGRCRQAISKLERQIEQYEKQ